MKLISQERFQLSLVFKLRVFGTRKWPIQTRLIDLFIDTVAILNKFDLRSIMACPWGMSKD